MWYVCHLYMCSFKWLVSSQLFVKSNLQTLTAKILHKNYTIKVLATPDTDQTCKSPQVLARQVFHIQHRCDPSTHNLNAFPVIYRNTEEWERERSHAPAVPAVSFHFLPSLSPSLPASLHLLHCRWQAWNESWNQFTWRSKRKLDV